jgi:hypothetical protein
MSLGERRVESRTEATKFTVRFNLPYLMVRFKSKSKKCICWARLWEDERERDQKGLKNGKIGAFVWTPKRMSASTIKKRDNHK